MDMEIDKGVIVAPMAATSMITDLQKFQHRSYQKRRAK